MRYDLKTPCRNCPFRSDETRITFSCRERAEEIEESAYRNGFPCHLSAVYLEGDDEGDNDGFVPGPNTQHCIGYILMKMHEGCETEWPGIGNDEDLLERLWDRVDLDAPVFRDTEEFLNANSGRARRSGSTTQPDRASSHNSRIGAPLAPIEAAGTMEGDAPHVLPVPAVGDSAS